MRSVRTLSFVATLLLLPVFVAQATGFPDVPDTHPYAAAINAMAHEAIVRGYADGTFKPGKTVNRAEFATLLLRATGDSAPHSDGCVDVKGGQWYTDVMCYYASKDKGILTGYNDGKLYPEKTVSRVEAITMLIRAFKFQLANSTDIDTSLSAFVDMSTTAWYAKYMNTAYKLHILPIDGQTGPNFFPDRAVLRGEAAAYLDNALFAANASSSSAAAVSSSLAAASSAAAAASASSSSSSAQFLNKTVSVPFFDTHVSAKKNESMSYIMNLTEKKTILTVNAVVTGYYESALSCRLYKLETRDEPNQANSSVSQNYSTYEYYLGIPSLRRCDVKAALGPGKYQFEVISSDANAIYDVNGVTSIPGDGNDGFIEAVTLTPNVARTAFMDSGDVFDAYQFTVTKTGTYNVQLTGTSAQGIIYEPKGINDASFTGPAVNVPFEFQPATYTVIIAHKAPLNQKISYTISVNKQ